MLYEGGRCMNKTRNIGLDCLKIISILGMIALHTQRSLETGVCYNPILYYMGRFCMPVFFMINGALILEKEDFGRKYFKKKVFNIVRLLIVWAIINGLVFCFCYGFSIYTFAWNFLKSFLAKGIVPFWFMYTFIIIYLILMFRFNWVKLHLKQLLLCTGVIMIIFDVISTINIFRGGNFIQSNIPQGLRIWTWLFYFLLGYRLKNIKHIWKIKKINWLLLTFITMVSVWWQYYLCSTVLKQINSEYLYDNVLIMIWCSLIFVCFINIKFSEKIKSIVTYISINSFGVFLLHGYFIMLFDLTNRISDAIQGIVLWGGLTIVCFICTVIFSFVPYSKYILRY